VTHEYHVKNYGEATYIDVKEGVRRYDVIFLGFQILRPGDGGYEVFGALP
jgi:hypothetical protein